MWTLALGMAFAQDVDTGRWGGAEMTLGEGEYSGGGGGAVSPSCPTVKPDSTYS
jgi:hypothetical protein